MAQWITGIGALWVLIGLCVGAFGVLMLFSDETANRVLFIGIGCVMITVGFALMGFAEIVAYFEKANRKQQNGNKRRRSG